MNNSSNTQAGRKRAIQTCLGTWQVSEKQKQKLGLRPQTRLSPQLEKSCLLLSANVSYANASRDLEVLTGMKVSHSTQQRLVHRWEFRDLEVKEEVTTISIDGGKVRLRTPKGEASEWRDYKAVSLQDQGCAAFWQENETLVNWLNRQPLAKIITCLGDGHPGVWNLMDKIATPEKRREILDWYHLKENLYKVGGSNQRLRTVETHLWHGKITAAIADFADWDGVQAQNFLAYLHRHRFRLPDYQKFQSEGITIGSGSVESTIKRLGLRLKLSGTQWKRENISQVLKHRCAYLNLAFA